ncbi:hypothetical protein MMC13_002846 [Lambiella insularis]|nr:hypothetical protein [Lambiella insularis]
MQRALAVLYEASVYLYPTFRGPFTAEDAVIRDSTSAGKATIRTHVEEFLQKIGLVVGNVVGSDETSHWFRPDSTYAIVSRALDHPRSAAALATRVWLSIVAEGKDALTVNDIAEVLGPHRREEAEECFKALDENDNKDIRLKEMTLSVIDTGRSRQTVYKGINEINHTINTFDWITVAAVDFIMIFFILFNWVPQVQSLKEIVGFATLGLGFAIGRTVHEFLSGCIFIFFKHAYDIGDRVDIYNLASTSVEPVVVSHISILYTLFTCLSDGSVLQVSNDRLALKDIKNITRSGANKEKISVFVDFTTTFKDIQLLRNQLQDFVLSKEGSRDYFPKVDVRVLSIHDLTKLELKVIFTHKSNWSDEPLRAARSSKFMCALVAAIRRVPLIRPMGTIMPVGDETRPNLVIHLSDAEAAKKTAAAVQKKVEKRMDYVKPAAPPEPRHDTTLPEIRIEDEESLQNKAQEEKAKADAAKTAAAEQAATAAAAKAAEEAAYNALTVVPAGNASKGPAADDLGQGTGSEIEGLGFLQRVTTGLRRTPAGREQSPYYN